MALGGSARDQFGGGGAGGVSGIAGIDVNREVRGGALAPTVAGPNVFQQAGDVQTESLQEAIDRLLGFGGFDPFAEAGIEGLTGLREGATTQGFGARLNEIIGGEAFGGLTEERMRNLQSALGTAGLSRSGVNLAESAAIPLTTALELEGVLSGRQAGLAGLGFQATGKQAGLEQMIAQLLGFQGEAQAGGILGEKAFQAQRSQAKSDRTNQLIALGISAFSDPRLKKNIQNKGKIGPLDLIYWDWIDEVKGTIVEACRNFGFMSTQVKEYFPDCVGEFGGYDTVDYDKLSERLECL